jgi:hypothetical protein
LGKAVEVPIQLFKGESERERVFHCIVGEGTSAPSRRSAAMSVAYRLVRDGTMDCGTTKLSVR